MNSYNIDFHIHSKYSGGTSKNMELPIIASQAELKGLHAVGTSDALHPLWLKHMKYNLVEEATGIYTIKNSRTRFLVTTEVEDRNRVHHVILFPSIDSAADLRERLKKHSVDIDRDGRPHLRLSAVEIVDYAKDVDAMVGPSHAFTPWTAIYKEFGSLRDCYGDNVNEIKFLELGLSADTYMADRISELQDIVFMTNSDCHSPWPHRLGREFNRLMLKELNYEEIKLAILRKNDRKFVLNAGLNPNEGKYHITACSRCYLKFSLKDALGLKSRCPECKGLIKKGVMDKIEEIATWEKPRHPQHRPRYLHIIPLAEVISMAIGIINVNAKRVQAKWNSIVGKFGTEINVLVDADVGDIIKEEPDIGRIIKKFREGKIRYIAGGGGQYGRPTLKGEKDEYWGKGQKRLVDW